ncbi:uncharacterized protein CANTADRAFT_87466 [Suhomyces tanzawaensis NRRL Y-17324]|uniref:Uncharacterized protein n=1 Tax=Suhomyces tanzawaensis NRRL Y-17324 TaxID=984487 RepID=A0A1E4SPX0_9ASCO|nr:uncharacterized protein CANTADRAFT_87466 [Suhomyces tanzawaensis NRRL Y-17324]ODV81477.1 hypothetical protein CANTADRAFT_87466 [Suhomyces tanzawaensis NRRL Y-17324]
MAITRSNLDTKRPTKKKFLDTDVSEIEYHTADEINAKEEPPKSQPEQDSESDSDSDEAPEEESTSSSKKAIIERQKQERLAQQKLKEEERELRRQKDLKFKQQQEAKKERELEKLANKPQELPEFLPDDIFEALEEKEPKGKHMKAKELDEMSQKLLRQKMKEEKLRKLKESRTGILKKGPINVQVQSFNLHKKAVPKAESRILDTKAQWFNRSSLNKK